MPKRSVSLLFIAATPIIILAILLALIANPLPARAATLTLGTDCATLQACVTAASPGDIIEVPAGTFSATITINKALTINGSGMTTTILDGESAGRVLDIPIAVPVTITNLTIQNGATSGLGGAIFAGATLLLEQVKIDNNIASNGGGIWVEGKLTTNQTHIINNQCDDAGCLGGGLYARSGAVLSATTVMSNTAVTGGGILVVGPITLTNSSLQNNHGGGLNGTAEVTLQNSQVISNSAASGGGVRSGGHFAAIDSLLQANNCTVSGCRGGAIHSLATAAITNSIVLSNSGGVGGGLWANGNVTLNGGDFSANSCLASGCLGGAIYTNGTLAASAVDFANNSSVSDGGAVASIGLLTLINSNFDTNEAPDSAGAAWAFAGLKINGGSFTNNRCSGVNCLGGAVDISGFGTIENAYFGENSAWFGGGAVAGDTLVITNTIFITNVATLNGGGVYANGQASLNGADFTNNSAVNGGGIFANGSISAVAGSFVNNLGSGVVSGGALEINGTTFNDNVGSAGAGARSASSAEVTEATFANNRCTTTSCHGGALSVGTTAIISGSDFIGNIAEFSGGALWSSGAVTVTDSLFLANDCEVAGCLGGGIYSNEVVNIASGSVISGNHSFGDGGGIYTFASLTINEATLFGNVSDSNGGGAWSNGSIQVLTSTVASNNSAVGGGGIYANGDIILQNAIIVSNSADFSGGGIYANGFLNAADSMLTGNESGTLGGGAWIDEEITLAGGSVVGNSSLGSAGGLSGRAGAEVNGTLFQDNMAGDSSGALGIAGTVIISDATFIDNAAQTHGGGLNATNVTVHNSYFNGNQAGQNGGAILAIVELNIYGSEFISNSAGFSGGAAKGADVEIIDATFTENQCEGSPCVGGAVATGTTLLVLRTTFTGNMTSGIGGALYVVGPADIRQTTFIQNHADISGGAAYHDIQGASTYENSLFDDNRAIIAGAGLYLNNGAVATLNHSTVAGRAGNIGEGVAVNNGTLNMLSSIVAFYGVGVRNNDAASIENTVFGGNGTDAIGITLGASNYLMNPRFADPANGNYRLSPGSVAIDNAQPSAVVVDRDGNVRPFGDGPDIGAYESPYAKDQLSVQVTLEPQPNLLPGQPVTYTIIYANSADIVAYDIGVNAMLPEELIDVSYLSSHVITQTGTTDYSWEVGSLPPLASRLITVTGRIDPTIITEMSISNTVAIFSDNTIMQSDVTADIRLPDVQFAATAVTAAETDGFVTVQIELAIANPYVPIEVDFVTADGTAVAGQDYVALTGSVTIAAGDTTAPIQLTILHNVRKEEPEMFTVNISSSSGAIPNGDIAVTVTITDTDLEFYVSIVLFDYSD